MREALDIVKERAQQLKRTESNLHASQAAARDKADQYEAVADATRRAFFALRASQAGEGPPAGTAAGETAAELEAAAAAMQQEVAEAAAEEARLEQEAAEAAEAARVEEEKRRREEEAAAEAERRRKEEEDRIRALGLGLGLELAQG